MYYSRTSNIQAKLCLISRYNYSTASKEILSIQFPCDFIEDYCRELIVLLQSHAHHIWLTVNICLRMILQDSSMIILLLAYCLVGQEGCHVVYKCNWACLVCIEQLNYSNGRFSPVHVHISVRHCIRIMIWVKHTYVNYFHKTSLNYKIFVNNMYILRQYLHCRDRRSI